MPGYAEDLARWFHERQRGRSCMYMYMHARHGLTVACRWGARKRSETGQQIRTHKCLGRYAYIVLGVKLGSLVCGLLVCASAYSRMCAHTWETQTTSMLLCILLTLLQAHELKTLVPEACFGETRGVLREVAGTKRFVCCCKRKQRGASKLLPVVG